MARRNRWIAATVIGMASALPAHPYLRHPDWASPTRGWAGGPVWYVMTNREYTSYRRLRTDPDRRDFIRDFWRQRDPLPDTAENELEQEFWRRVEIADSHFGQEVKPGWKTERGKVFIMLGPPENFDHDRILEDTWGARRWVYDLGSMPSQLRLVLQDSLRIPTQKRFASLMVRDEPAGTRSVGGRTASQHSVLRPTDLLPLAETLVRRVPGSDALRQLGSVMRVPEVIERARSHVDVTTMFGLVPMKARVDFRPGSAPERDRTIVAVTLGVAIPGGDVVRDGEAGARIGVSLPDGTDTPVLTGHLTSIDDETKTYPLDGTFAPDPMPDPQGPVASDRVYQSVRHVPAGRYLLDVVYQDPARRVVGSVRDVIDVPAFPERGLGVSSLVLASRLERIESVADVDAPFMLGGYRVIPRTTQVYGHDDTLVVFYEITGARPGADGLPTLDLSYQFYLEEAGLWLPVGASFKQPDVTEPTQAWSVPLASLPQGRYRLEVTVVDEATQAAALRGTYFEIGPSALP